MIQIRLHNTKSRRRELFMPIDPDHVKLYVCGPTVYDHAHIGNARPVVVFDVLVRLLRHVYPRVTYVRNITDVDDKINAKSAETGEPIATITARTTAWYHRDMAALFAVLPDIEPRATAHMGEIISMIERLIAGGHAYEADGHVLFAVRSDADYGAFSGRSPDELLAGARVDVATYKRDPGDFVLWKPSPDALPGWESPWGRGRPGWHIECSAMIHRHLGTDFDIHGGGDDLIFPHHENEIAQSTCAFPESGFARIWMHVHMLQVNGEKMSKSLGNYVTVEQVLARTPGEALRFLLLKTHYRSTLDFTEAALAEAKRELDRFYRALGKHPNVSPANGVPDCVLDTLTDDLNTPAAITGLHALADAALGGDESAAASMMTAGNLLGIFNSSASDWFRGDEDDAGRIKASIAARLAARKSRDFTRADAIRAELAESGIILEDSATGTTWRRA
ncbi:MAG: cysteine--tRNA ligase [Acidiphilium sp.]|nr:cysteine--tRNA ligase [Acidiphilium sp.]MDD4935563.1 cysteine--tRNA ligase [Acidiphilium sp.]